MGDQWEAIGQLLTPAVGLLTSGHKGKLRTESQLALTDLTRVRTLNNLSSMMVCYLYITNEAAWSMMFSKVRICINLGVVKRTFKENQVHRI